MCVCHENLLPICLFQDTKNDQWHLLRATKKSGVSIIWTVGKQWNSNTLNNCHIWVYTLLTLKIALNHFIFVWFWTRCIVIKTSPTIKFIYGFDFKFPAFSWCISMCCFDTDYNKNGTNLKLKMQISPNSKCV